MEFLIVIGLIIWAVSSSAGKAKRAREAQRRKEASRRQVFEQKQTVAAPTRRAKPIRPRVQPTVQVTQTTPMEPERHVVQPSLNGGHGHSESSMTGFEPCPPDIEKPLAERLADFKAAKRAAARAIQAAPDSDTPTVQQFDDSAYPFSWDPAAVRNGLIYAEILGKPKALRR